MDDLKCPKCGSTNVQKQCGFAALKREGESVQEPHIIPNECREENCRFKWFNK